MIERVISSDSRDWEPMDSFLRFLSLSSRKGKRKVKEAEEEPRKYTLQPEEQ